MCHISRENVWSIIKKASLPKKCVRNKAQRDAFLSYGQGAIHSSEERLSDFETKGETIPPNWKMQQARTIPKTYQREQYPTF